MQASRQEGGCRGNPRLGARKPGDWEKWNDRRREKKSVCEMRNMTAERLITQEGENDRKTKKGNHRDWHVSGSKRREGGTDGCCLEGGGREWTHRGWCGGRGCLWWSVGDRDPPSPWRSAGWGSAVNLCQPPPLHRNTWGEKKRHFIPLSIRQPFQEFQSVPTLLISRRTFKFLGRFQSSFTSQTRQKHLSRHFLPKQKRD